ncbi:MAG: HlyD family efflux transporter periplasmic adaptor subunit [Bacillota bacterium]|nr:HlyD family efflux transporter periplasmic adaptor subunit [Bacillota bacterium]
MAEAEKMMEEVSFPDSIPTEDAVIEKNEKKVKARKKKKFPIWLILLIVVALLIGVVAWRKVASSKNSGEKVNTAPVTYGNITKTIKGEGTLKQDQYQATSLVKGEITACYIEEGDYVKKDQVLYEIDSGDMENSVKRAQNSLKTSKNGYEEALDNIEDLNIKAPIGGVIQKIYVSNGDQVNSGTKIADIIDSGTMKLTINFLQSDAQNMWVGESAAVTLTTSSERLTGTVSKISTGALVNSDGVAVATVEIAVKNPGAIVPGNKATAMVGNYACTDTGTFEYNESEAVTAKQNGKIRNLKYNTADNVSEGSVIATIENTNLTNGLESARISYENAQLNLDDLNKTLDDYKIKSTIAGKVIQKNSKLGDNIDNTSGQTVMAIISDPSELSFEMSVDELDIKKIKVGQEVEVTADAVEGAVFKGHIDTVSEVGTAESGVTTYPVKVIIDDNTDSQLIPGMNVNAVITIASKEHILMVPSSAIQRGNIVYVKKSSNESGNTEEKSEKKTNSDKNKPVVKNGGYTANGVSGSSKNISNKILERMSKNAPEGYKAVIVETGLSDDTNVEIISGLSKGDIVVVQEQETSSNKMTMMGMNGGMNGGMRGMNGGMSRNYSGQRSTTGSSQSSTTGSSQSSGMSGNYSGQRSTAGSSQSSTAGSGQSSSTGGSQGSAAVSR